MVGLGVGAGVRCKRCGIVCVCVHGVVCDEASFCHRPCVALYAVCACDGVTVGGQGTVMLPDTAHRLDIATKPAHIDDCRIIGKLVRETRYRSLPGRDLHREHENRLGRDPRLS